MAAQFTANNFMQNPNDFVVHIQNPNLLFHNNLLNPQAIPFQNPIFPANDSGFQAQNHGRHAIPFQYHSGVVQAENRSSHAINFQNPNFQAQSSDFQAQSSGDHYLSFPQPKLPRQNVNENIERIDREVVKVRCNILESGNNVSAWTVAQSVLSALKVDSWESLGFQMRQIPALHNLIVTEGKINSFIHCFVGVTRITTLYDLDMEICKNEGVKQFEELKLGPLVRHPLVVHYFRVSSDAKEVFRITSEEIISYLHDFMDSHEGKKVTIDELLDFIAAKYSLTAREELNVRIQNLGSHISHIRKALQLENTTLQKYVGRFKEKFGIKIRKHPLLSFQKKQLDDHLKDISECTKPFSFGNVEFCRKTTGFSSSRSDDADSDDADSGENQHDNKVQSHMKSHNPKTSERVSSCPYPSATEVTQLGKPEVDESVIYGSEKYVDGSKEKIGIKIKKHPVLSSQEKQLDDYFKDIPNRTKPFSIGNVEFCGKHTRFSSSSSDDVGSNAVQSRSKSHNQNTSERVRSCPYPSATEEMTRLGLKSEVDGSVICTSDARINRNTEALKRKRTSYRTSGSETLPWKMPRRDLDEVNPFSKIWKKGSLNEDLSKSISSESTRIFIATWKEACSESSVDEVLDRMLHFYTMKKNKKKKLKALFSSYPFAGLLDVAVKSIKSGTWDSMYNAFQTLGHGETTYNVSENQNQSGEEGGLVSSNNTSRHECMPSVLGVTAPYVVPKVKSQKLLSSLEMKYQIRLSDIFVMLGNWRRSETPIRASISQMSKFYIFIWNEMATSKPKIAEKVFSGPFIFVPSEPATSPEDDVPGFLLGPKEVYWYDKIGSLDKMRLMHAKCPSDSHLFFSKMLCSIYPSLHDFFVNECGVRENPPCSVYLNILLQFSAITLPKQAARTVFDVFSQWSEGLISGSLCCDDIEYLKRNFQRKDCAVLPTVNNKWVSLHPSFGFICWSIDDNLRNEFKHINSIDLLSFGDLKDEEKQIFQPKVAPLLQRLGIPALSEVVSREAIYYGPTDSSFKASLINWALPYAQRYIYHLHPDEYDKLRKSELENLRCLQIVVVEKLFYRNIIKRCEIASKKRSECNCLLEGNILYITRKSDSLSIYMELSGLFFDKAPQLELANFLHMITTMAEAGSTEDQTEFFILNSQKVPMLPAEEPLWSLSSPFLTPGTEKLPIMESDSPAGYLGEREKLCLQSNHNDNIVISSVDMVLESVDLVNELNSLRNQLSSGTYSTQAHLTGRLGEFVAFKHFVGKFGETSVNWVNEANETGLPYDLVVGGEERCCEYVEVKSTKSEKKDLFEISVREWQFAVEKGELFSIAHIVLFDSGTAKVTVYKNLLKLCHLGKLRLAVVMPKLLEESNVA